MTNKEYQSAVFLKRHTSSGKLVQEINNIESKLDEIINLYFDSNVLLRNSKESSESLDEKFDDFVIGVQELLKVFPDNIVESLNKRLEKNSTIDENESSNRELIEEFISRIQNEKKSFYDDISKNSSKVLERIPNSINKTVVNEATTIKSYLDSNLKILNKIERSSKLSNYEYTIVLLEEVKKLTIRSTQFQVTVQKKQSLIILLQLIGFSVLFVMILFLFF
jgi:hypothetical protein